MWSHSFIQSLTPFSWGHLRNTLSATLNIALAIKISDTPHYENVPFEVPAGWEWCIVDDIAYVASGSTPDKSAFVPDGIPYIKMYNLKNQKIDFESHPQYIKEEVHNGKLQRSRTEVGDLIMNIVGPPLGKLAIIPPSLPQSNFNQAAVLIRPYLHKGILVKYLFYYLSEMSEINSISTKGSAGQVNISLTQSQNMRIALPPIQEQQRIVSELDKYFAIVDDLEWNKGELVDIIKLTKTKILDLAIRGKLVPQDPTDEPASELLKRINPDAKPCDTSHYKNIPSSWCVCTLKDVFEITMGSSPKGSSINTQKNGIEFHQGKISFTDMHLQETNVYTDEPTKLAEPHSILLCVRAPVGIVNITERNVCIGRGLCALKPTVGVDYKFAFYTLQTHKANFDKQATGTTFKAIGGDIIRNEKYVLPPYQEQIRIREKIEYILQLLNAITAEL